MPSLRFISVKLCLTLGLAGVLAAVEPPAVSAPPAAVAAEHFHLQKVPTHSKTGYVIRSVACTEVHPAPLIGPKHTHRWYKPGDKRPGQWITVTCTQIHPEYEPKSCPMSSPKGGCARKPSCR